MAVLPSDIAYKQSLDTDSLGGGISSNVVPTGLNLYFGDVDQAEAETGSTAYRCFYVENNSALDTLLNTILYISVRTPSPSTFCELGLGTSGLNGVEQSISDESIAPVGVTFFATSEAQPLNIGALGPGEFYPVWIKRVVQPEAVGAANDNVILAVKGNGGP